MNQYPLPEGWRWARISEVCEKPEYGFTASAENKPIGPKLLRISDIQYGVVNWDDVPYCRCESNFDRYLLKPGDILFARTGGTTGKSYLIKDVPAKSIFASYLIRLKTKENLFPEYLYLFLQSDLYWKQVDANKRGGAQPNLNATLLSNLVFPFPPLPEQRRIARKIQELMQDMDRARAACENQLEAAKALPSAYLREVFESEKAKNWETNNLGDICKIIMGQSPPSDSYNKESLGLPFFQGKADFGDYFPVPQIWCSIPIKIAKPNDVLISVRAPVGPVNLANQECCVGRGLAVLRPKADLDSWFLFFYFKFIEPNWKGRGSTFDAIRKKDLENIEIPLPPFSMQKGVSSELKERLAVAESLRSSIWHTHSGLNAIPKEILGKAFRGEL